jgi:hypothetical protein
MWSLILSLVSLCAGPLLAIPAIILGFLGLRDISRSQGQLGGKALAIVGVIVGFIETLVVFPVICLVLFKVVTTATETADRSRTQSRLSQIGLAMHNYAVNNNGRFPPAVLQEPGGQPYSWRVALLPYLDEQGLVYNFNEPWDSPANLQLLARMPRVYAHPRADPQAPAGSTYFQAFVGPGTIFGEPQMPSLAAISNSDGVRNTVMVVESAEPVPWTKPQDLPLDPSGPLPKLGRFPGGFLALFVDRSCRFMPQNARESSIKSILTWNGREPWPADLPP